MWVHGSVVNRTASIIDTSKPSISPIILGDTFVELSEDPT